MQRLRLAAQLGSGLTGALYVLDEPTAGLHPSDVEPLVESIIGLRDRGNTVVVVEHDEALIRAADEIIEIGIVLVQGGVGVYPAFVALMMGIYMDVPEGGGLIRPDALAMGWLLWVAQTLMFIVLGGLSLLLISRKGKPDRA